MDDENAKKLTESFPNLYGERDPRQPFRAYGFECGNGWFQLLHDASAKIEQEILKFNIRERDGFHASQVKEKFGTLRFYMSQSTDEIENIIREAEDKSAVTCENCGKPGSMRGGRWMVTECDDCAMKSIIRHVKGVMLTSVEQYDTMTWDKKPTKEYRYTEEDKLDSFLFKLFKTQFNFKHNKEVHDNESDEN